MIPARAFPAGVTRFTGGMAAAVLAAGAAALIGLWDQPAAVAGILAGLAVLLVSLARLEYLLAATTVTFFLASSAAAALIPFADTVRWVMLALTLCVVLARVATNPAASRVAAAKLPLPLMVFLGVAVVSVGWSIEPAYTLGRSAAVVALFVLAAALPKLGVGVSRLLLAFRYLASAVAVANAVTFVLPIPGASERFAGVFENPNYLGVATALLFPVTVGSFLGSGRGLMKAWFLVTSCLLVIEAALAGSRGGLLAMAAAYVFLALKMSRQTGASGGRALPRVGGATALIALPVVALVEASVSGNVERITSLVNSRSPLWDLFPTLFRGAPVVGHGFGTTQFTLIPYASGIGFGGPRGVDLHNSYLNVLDDLGIIGGLLILATIVGIVLRLRSADAVLGATVVAGLVSATFESWLFSVGSGFPMVFWLAALYMAQRPGSDARVTGSSGPVTCGADALLHEEGSRPSPRAPIRQAPLLPDV